MHQAIQEWRYDEITVVGAYTRTSPSEIFQGGKLDKIFNWQRLNALVVGNKLLLSLGNEKFYKATNPFNFMETISLTGKTNFFREACW